MTDEIPSNQGVLYELQKVLSEYFPHAMVTLMITTVIGMIGSEINTEVIIFELMTHLSFLAAAGYISALSVFSMINNLFKSEQTKNFN